MKYKNFPNSITNGNPGYGHILVRYVCAGDGRPGDTGERRDGQPCDGRTRHQDRGVSGGNTAEGLYIQVREDV